MKIVTNEKIVKRNARIAQITVPVGMVVVLGGMVVLLKMPQQVGLIWGLVLLGFAVSQVGIYFTNRWGRRPRPDEQLNNGLKGLDDNYAIYHYTTPVSHLLVGPAGVWVLLPRYQRGVIRFEKGRWRQKASGVMLNYLRIFGQEGIGRPDLEIKAEIETAESYLKKLVPETEFPPVQAALVFTDERATVEADEAPTPTLQLKKLKELIRKFGKSKTLSMDKVKLVQEAIGE